MKRVFILFVLLMLIVPFVCLAEEIKTEMVVNMVFTMRSQGIVCDGKYTGEVINGVPNGYGVFTATNLKLLQWHYLGEWKNGEMFGKGGCYYDNGRAEVGTYENGSLVEGDVYNHTSRHYKVCHTDTDEDGCYRVIDYRTDGSLVFDGYINSSGDYHRGTVYTKDGEVFFSGEIGKGFDWNLLYVK